jgi:C4-dicarboxylate-specific signal transduction histidine kinase
MLTASAAAAGHWYDSQRALVASAIVALIACAISFGAIKRLSTFITYARPDPEFGIPPDLAALRTTLLTIEARLEHAPVALLRLNRTGIEPLNVAARRILAPGGANASQLFEQLSTLNTDQKSLIAFESERGHERALLAINTVVISGEESRILALMPIESELEAETLVAWRQLVHVLTHEIMNSLTPIASLSRTAQEMLADPPQSGGAANASEDLTLALEAIARRAAHLVTFVSSYRSVSELPPPQPEPVRLDTLFARLERLVAPQWRERNGAAIFEVSPASVELMADPGQLEQALINLIKNAAEATVQVAKPTVNIKAHMVRGGRLAIEITDNGPGVPSGLESRIFTPFFTTRAQGSGIGLAVVRNLVHGMGGTVRYAKRASGGACFVLAF